MWPATVLLDGGFAHDIVVGLAVQSADLELTFEGAFVVTLQRGRVIEELLDEIFVGDGSGVRLDFRAGPGGGRWVRLKQCEELELGAAHVFEAGDGEAVAGVRISIVRHVVSEIIKIVEAFR